MRVQVVDELEMYLPPIGGPVHRRYSLSILLFVYSIPLGDVPFLTYFRGDSRLFRYTSFKRVV